MPPKCCTSQEKRRGQELNANFVSQTFRAPPGYPGKIPGYPAKKFGFPGFRRTYRTFWPPPIHVKDPHPTRQYPDRKVGAVLWYTLVAYMLLSAKRRHRAMEMGGVYRDALQKYRGQGLI